MKLSGDVPQAHKDLAAALDQAEADVSSGPLSPERKAQIYTCLAFDWFDMSVEEEGNRLLLKADKICPDYFKTTVKKHMDEDPIFDYLVKRIAVELVKLLPGLKS